MRTEEPATCPQCASGSIQAVPVKRSEVAAAVLNQLAFGVAAGVAEGSSTIIQAVCLKCGCQWIPGTQYERNLRALSGQFGEEEQQKIKQALDLATAEEERKARAESDDWKAKIMLALILAFLGLLLSR